METIIESKFDFGRVVATTTLANYSKRRDFQCFLILSATQMEIGATYARKTGRAMTRLSKTAKGCYLNINSQMIGEFG